MIQELLKGLARPGALAMVRARQPDSAARRLSDADGSGTGAGLTRINSDSMSIHHRTSWHPGKEAGALLWIDRH